VQAVARGAARFDAVAAGEEQLVSCTAEQRIYLFIYTETLDSYSDLPFSSWGRWQCLRGGAGAVLNSFYTTRHLLGAHLQNMLTIRRT
jgi:hypothetical protein